MTLLLARMRRTPLPMAFASRRHISAQGMGRKETPFSQSQAYYGRDRLLDPSMAIPLYTPSYYDSRRFKLIRLSSMLASTTAIYVYLIFFREKRDLDELMSLDPRLVSLFQEKQKLSMKKEALMWHGKDTRELDMEMLELIAKEAELRANSQGKQSKEAPRPSQPRMAQLTAQMEAAKRPKRGEGW